MEALRRALTSPFLQFVLMLVTVLFYEYRITRMRRSRDYWERAAGSWKAASEAWQSAYVSLKDLGSGPIIRSIQVTYPEAQEQPGLFDSARKVPAKKLC